MSITTLFVATIAPASSTPLDLCKVVVTDRHTGAVRVDWEVWCDGCGDFLITGVTEAEAREAAEAGHDCPGPTDHDDDELEGAGQ